MSLVLENEIKCIGWVEALVEYRDGTTKKLSFKNSVLRKGRAALASSLANSYGDSFNYYISRMVFGDGGTTAGTTKEVNSNRNGLFGLTRGSKPVISSVDPTTPTKAIFTSVLTFNDANGFALNEMGLMMNNGDMYSMSTFPDLSKNEQMQITWSWNINFV